MPAPGGAGFAIAASRAAGRAARWSPRTPRPAPTAWPSWPTRRPPLPAPLHHLHATAGRASPSSPGCRTTGRHTTMAALPDVRAAARASTPTRPTAASTRSRWPATTAARGCGCWCGRRPGADRRYAEPTRTAGRGPAAAGATGAIVAVKGLGGYHLACDAGRTEAVVRLLRRRKAPRRQAVRGDGPRASADVEPLVHLGAAERALLTGSRAARRAAPQACRRRRGAVGRRRSRPAAPTSGSCSPYTPLHHLLLGLPGDPPGPRLLVMTSGNLSGEPIVTDDEDALRPAGAASPTRGWPTTGRSTCRATTRWCGSATASELPVRRSRGYAPLPVAPAGAGAARARGRRRPEEHLLPRRRAGYAWLSAHVGDMDDLATLHAFERAEAQLAAITGVRPERRWPPTGTPATAPRAGPTPARAAPAAAPRAAPPRAHRLGDGRARPRRHAAR